MTTVQHSELICICSDTQLNKTQKALLFFHCKHGYVNAPQCYVMLL